MIRMKFNTIYLSAAITSLGAIFSAQASAQVQNRLLLPLPTDGNIKYFLPEIFNDPALDRLSISSDSEAQTILGEITEIERFAGRQAKNKKNEFLKRSISLRLRYLDYLNSQRLGLIDSSARSTNIDSQINREIATISKHLKAFSKSANIESDKTWITYQALMLNGQSSKIKSSDFNALAKANHLSNAQRQRIYLIQAIVSAETTKAMKLINGISRRSRAGVFLVAAHYASASSKSSTEIDSALAKISLNAKNSEKAHRELLLAQMIKIYLRTHKSGVNWSRTPFSASAFADLDSWNSVVERDAYYALKKADYPRSSRIYQTLAQKYEGKNEGMSYELNALNAEKLYYHKNNDPRKYEALLTSLLNKYKDKSEGESKQKIMLSMIEQRYQELVDHAVKIARQNKATSSQRKMAIALSSRYSSRSSDKNQQEKYQAIVAELFALDGQHAKAVTLYLDLALNGNEKFRETYLLSASESQAILAHWNPKEPWKQGSRVSSRELHRLADIYSKIVEIQKDKAQWQYIANLGLVQIRLGQRQAAYAMWSQSISSMPRSLHAQKAGGNMSEYYEAQKDWANLEAISRICLKVGLKALDEKNRPIDSLYLLASSLLYGGKELLEKGDAALASKKLKEFTDKFRADKRRDEGLYFLSHAQRKNGEHVESIETTTDLVENHPNSRFLAAILVEGGDAASGMALEEHAIKFYRRYVNRFASGKNAPRVREALVDLYVGRELFGDAITMLGQTASANTSSKATRIAAAKQRLDLEHRYGDMDKAKIAAQNLLQQSGSDFEAKAHAYMSLSQYAYTHQDTKGLATIEGQLSKLVHHPAISEVLGEVRYYLAELKSKELARDHYSIQLRDPLATLNQEFKIYESARSLYDGSCAVGSSFCAAALLQKSTLSDSLASRLEEITIPETLAASVVKQFSARKQKILDQLVDDSQHSITKANVHIKQVHTRPDLVQEVLWENSSDWNFDSISGETGNGYIQIEPKTGGE